MLEYVHLLGMVIIYHIRAQKHVHLSSMVRMTLNYAKTVHRRALFAHQRQIVVFAKVQRL